jgi:hypothetical protein
MYLYQARDELDKNHRVDVRQSWCYCTLHTVSVVYTHETKNLFMNRGEKCTYFFFFTFFLHSKKA